MVVVVLEQGWSVSSGGGGGRVSASGRARSGWRGSAPRVELGLLDRSSAPRLVANRTDRGARSQVIAALRRLRFTGPEIAEVLGRPLSTVSGILTRIGMGRLGRLGLEPAERYERAAAGRADPHRRQEARPHPGRRGQARHAADCASTTTGVRPTAAGRRRRTVGWEYVHIAIDDATRLAYAEVLTDEKATHRDRVPAPRGRVLRPLRHHRRARADRQRLGLPLRPSTRSPAARWASATSAPAPAARRPTAKPNASSAPCSAAGPTARSTAPAQNAPQPLTAGSTTTTIAADTQPSADQHPSPA